jgi:hypothetical protein
LCTEECPVYDTHIPIAIEHLVGYSTAQPALFKRNQLEPVKDLKVLVKDYTPIAHNAITILINISSDAEVRENLASDKTFLETLVQRITVQHRSLRSPKPHSTL